MVVIRGNSIIMLEALDRIWRSFFSLSVFEGVSPNVHLSLIDFLFFFALLDLTFAVFDYSKLSAFW
jgi:hypothetical protein